MAVNNYVSTPELILKSDLLSTDSSFKLQNIQQYVGSDGVAVSLAVADFGTSGIGYGVFDERTSSQEFFTWDTTTLLSATTTGITILKRGLPWGSDYTTEATTRKFFHASGSRVLLFTNAPAFYDTFVNKANDETITGKITFPTGTNYPLVGGSYSAPTNDLHVATKKYVDGVALAGAPDATTGVKGVSEEATVAEDDAATAIGGTGARLFVNPNTLAQSVMANRYSVDSGSANTYAIATAGVITAYVAGQQFTFKATNANTGASTINVDGLGAKSIVKDASIALTNGDILAGEIVTVVYDGTNMQIVTSRGASPTGAVISYAGTSAPTNWLLCDGSAVSRTTYAALFSVLNPTLGTVTITIAAPGVVTLNSHGLATGDGIYLTTTGALPSGLSINTKYWVIKNDANTFWLATSLANALAGTKITTTGSQSGTHTSKQTPYGVGDGTTTFTLPSLKGVVPVGKNQSDSEFAGLGQTGGEKTHQLTVGELAAHTHTMTGYSGTGGAVQSMANTAGSGTSATSSTGSDTAHNNLQPYVTMNYIIKI